MASAAQRFFAIPELLEQALLHLGDHTVKDLFTAQRISHSVKAIIKGSRKLQLKMGLLHPLPKAQLDVPVFHAALSNFHNESFNIPPFKFCNRAPVTFRQGPGKPNGLCLNFIVPADYFAEEYLGIGRFRTGLKGKSGRVYNEEHHSWRKIQLAGAEIPIIVSVIVVKPRIYLEQSPYVGQSYTEWVRFRSNEGTLADLVDLFEEIGRKGRSEHQIGRPRYAGAYWMDVSKKTYLSLRWRRVVLVLVACCYVYVWNVLKRWWRFMNEDVFAILGLVIGLLVLAAVNVWLRGWEKQEDQEDMDDVLIFN